MAGHVVQGGFHRDLQGLLAQGKIDLEGVRYCFFSQFITGVTEHL